MIRQLRTFFLSSKSICWQRLSQPEWTGDGNEFTPGQRYRLKIKTSAFTSTRSSRVNFTTYDVRRGQDLPKPPIPTQTSCISHLKRRTPYHPFSYAQIIGIFHADILNLGGWDRGAKIQTKEFLRLHRLEFLPDSDPQAFGFLDPDEVIRGSHIIPAFARGRTTTLLANGSIGRLPRAGLAEKMSTVGGRETWDQLFTDEGEKGTTKEMRDTFQFFQSRFSLRDDISFIQKLSLKPAHALLVQEFGAINPLVEYLEKRRASGFFQCGPKAAKAFEIKEKEGQQTAKKITKQQTKQQTIDQMFKSKTSAPAESDSDDDDLFGGSLPPLTDDEEDESDLEEDLDKVDDFGEIQKYVDPRDEVATAVQYPFPKKNWTLVRDVNRPKIKTRLCISGDGSSWTVLKPPRSSAKLSPDDEPIDAFRQKVDTLWWLETLTRIKENTRLYTVGPMDFLWSCKSDEKRPRVLVQRKRAAKRLEERLKQAKKAAEVAEKKVKKRRGKTAMKDVDVVPAAMPFAFKSERLNNLGGDEEGRARLKHRATESLGIKRRAKRGSKKGSKK
ncbi:hypothetical protein R3P38DRAFT_2814712 [Favolaschia claudopus]|uniref:Uncharacterized protein n=1 Tax=Favolaschia claudopus TaxID=2862362 RepID=A0AAV9Z2V0_9AGAR